MPKVSIYLPDGLYSEVRERGIAVSAVAQRALEEAVRGSQNALWVQRAGQRERRTSQSFDTSTLMEQVRDEFGT